VCEAVTQGKKGLSNSISCLKQRGSSAPVRGGKGQQQDAAHVRTRAQQLFSSSITSSVPCASYTTSAESFERGAEGSDSVTPAALYAVLRALLSQQHQPGCQAQHTQCGLLR
jgi:hypothetical protein